MASWFRYLLALPKLVTLVREILDLVRHSEDLLSGGNNGAAKRALAIAVLGQTVDLAVQLGIPEAKDIDKGKLTSVAGVVIDNLVAVLNSLGIFKHATPA